jgi:hypothetical protein
VPERSCNVVMDVCVCARAQPAESSRSAGAPPSNGTTAEPRHPPATRDAHYLGPLAKQHKIIKAVSITNTALAFAAAPAIVYWTEISYVSGLLACPTDWFAGLPDGPVCYTGLLVLVF